MDFQKEVSEDDEIVGAFFSQFDSQKLNYKAKFSEDDLRRLNQGSFQEDILDWVYNTTRQSVEKYQLTSGIDGVFEIKDMADFYKTKQGDQYGLFYKDLTNPATGLCSPLFFFVFFF
jgi:hypothetical protein